jgi:glycosyltransferase involved in cell wall biosynthesis
MPDPSPPRSRRPIRIGLLGRFDPGKGMLTFVEAAGLSGLSSEEAVFVVGGSTGPFRDYEAQVRAKARAAGIDIIEPGVEGMAFLRNLDVVVIPSRYEGCPLALLESMSLAKAVVASDIPGIRSITGADGAVELVAPDDPSALGRALAHVAGDPAMRIAAGLRARVIVEARYGLDRSVNDALAGADAAVGQYRAAHR